MNTVISHEARPHGHVPLLVAYDISDNRRRNRLHRLLRGFGEPVQKSVFICWVDVGRRRRLETLLDDFGRATHKGDERIDCIPARAESLAGLRPQDDWVTDTPFVFERRQQHPPPDPVNAVLSLAYTLLLGEVEAGVVAAGLDPCVGFFHAIDNGHPALLMDLIEPLRPLADRFVARLLRSELKPEDFETREESCRLIDGRRGVFYRAWEKMLADRVVWRGESHAYRRLIHQQGMVLAAQLDCDAIPLHFWHIDAH